MKLPRLRPLPRNITRPCSLCGELQARWSVSRASEEIICGLCLLFRSDWAATNAQRVEDAIAQVQLQRPAPFEKLPETGILASCQDADDVLGVLVLTDMTLFARADPPGAQKV